MIYSDVMALSHFSVIELIALIVVSLTAAISTWVLWYMTKRYGGGHIGNRDNSRGLTKRNVNIEEQRRSSYWRTYETLKSANPEKNIHALLKTYRDVSLIEWERDCVPDYFQDDINIVSLDSDTSASNVNFGWLGFRICMTFVAIHCFIFTAGVTAFMIKLGYMFFHELSKIF